MLRRRKPPVTGRGFYIPVILAQAGINSPQGSECCGGDKPPVTGRGFYIPVIPAQAGIHPFAILLFARKRKRRFIAENGKPPAAAKAAGN